MRARAPRHRASAPLRCCPHPDDRAYRRIAHCRRSIRLRIVPLSGLPSDRRLSPCATGHLPERVSAGPTRCRGRAPSGSLSQDAVCSASLFSSYSDLKNTSVCPWSRQRRSELKCWALPPVRRGGNGHWHQWLIPWLIVSTPPRLGRRAALAAFQLDAVDARRTQPARQICRNSATLDAVDAVDLKNSSRGCYNKKSGYQVRPVRPAFDFAGKFALRPEMGSRCVRSAVWTYAQPRA